MDIRLIEPGEIIKIQPNQNFYSNNAVVSIKAQGLSFSDSQSDSRYKFKITYQSLDGTYVSFPLILESPYFSTTKKLTPEYLDNNPNFQGPFHIIKIESECDKSIAIQISFADRINRGSD